MKPEIGLADRDREAVGKILSTLLADEVLLNTKTRNYHWNVVGLQFNELHKFFDAQYEELNDIIDEVAERARALGVPALGTLGEFLKAARLKETPGAPAGARTMIATLLADHESIVRALREDVAASQEKYGDAGTADLLTGVMEQHEKMAWMLRAFLAESGSTDLSPHSTLVPTAAGREAPGS